MKQIHFVLSQHSPSAWHPVRTPGSPLPPLLTWLSRTSMPDGLLSVSGYLQKGLARRYNLDVHNITYRSCTWGDVRWKISTTVSTPPAGACWSTWRRGTGLSWRSSSGLLMKQFSRLWRDLELFFKFDRLGQVWKLWLSYPETSEDFKKTFLATRGFSPFYFTFCFYFFFTHPYFLFLINTLFLYI